MNIEIPANILQTFFAVDADRYVIKVTLDHRIDFEYMECIYTPKVERIGRAGNKFPVEQISSLRHGSYLAVTPLGLARFDISARLKLEVEKDNLPVEIPDWDDKDLMGDMTKSVVGLFLKDEEAFECSQAKNLSQIDLRWEDETFATVKAIGRDHPIFCLSHERQMSFPIDWGSNWPKHRKTLPQPKKEAFPSEASELPEKSTKIIRTYAPREVAKNEAPLGIREMDLPSPTTIARHTIKSTHPVPAPVNLSSATSLEKVREHRLGLQKVSTPTPPRAPKAEVAVKQDPAPTPAQSWEKKSEKKMLLVLSGEYTLREILSHAELTLSAGEYELVDVEVQDMGTWTVLKKQYDESKSCFGKGWATWRQKEVATKVETDTEIRFEIVPSGS